MKRRRLLLRAVLALCALGALALGCMTVSAERANGGEARADFFGMVTSASPRKPAGTELAARYNASVTALVGSARSRPARRPLSTSSPFGGAAIMSAADAAFDDTVGDSQGGLSPDIRRVAVINDASGNIGIAVSYANRVPCIGSGDLLLVYIDTDQSAATGAPPLGVDYVLIIDATSNSYASGRWDGATFQLFNITSLQAACDPAAGGFNLFLLSGREIGIGTGFNFFAAGVYVDSAGTSYGDFAPDTGAWNYQLSSSTTPPPPPSPPPGPQPPEPSERTYADAPGLPKRERYTGPSIRHARAARTIYATMKLLRLGRQLQVACWSVPDWRSVVEDLGGRTRAGRNVLLGFWLPVQPRFLHLSPQVCVDLQALMSTRRASRQRATAATVALHETTHMYGVRNEAEANCYAVQLVYYFARRLRVPPAQALALERLAVRSTRASAPRGYWNSRSCRDGGEWDLDEEGANLSY